MPGLLINGMPESPRETNVVSAAEEARKRRQDLTDKNQRRIQPNISSDVEKCLLNSLAWHSGYIIPSNKKWKVEDPPSSAPVSEPATPRESELEPEPQPEPPFSSMFSSLNISQTSGRVLSEMSLNSAPEVVPAGPWWPNTTNFTQEARKMIRGDRRRAKTAEGSARQPTVLHDGREEPRHHVRHYSKLSLNRKDAQLSYGRHNQDNGGIPPSGRSV